MYCKFLGISIFTLLCCVSLVAQEPEREIDIEGVSIVGKQEEIRKEVGVRTTVIASSDIERNATKSLAELLLESSPIQIKSMGQGALSTASFRGTASSHTQVLWNGISINSPQLGSFDFSQVPIYFTDNVMLYHGSGAQNGGSGALGGSVNFMTSDRVAKAPQITFLSEYASNETFTEAATFRISSGGFTSSTRGYYQQSDNDYRYLNNVLSKDEFYERRKDADYKQAGVMQEFYYSTKAGDKLTAIGWWQCDDRSLPQSTIVNVTASEQSSSQNLRTMLSYIGIRGDHKFKATTSFLSGRLDYDKVFGNSTLETQNINRSLIARGDYNFLGFEKFALGANVNYRFDKVLSDNFEQGEISRNSITTQLYSTYKATQRLHFDAQLTGECVDGETFGIYSISGRYRVLGDYLSVKASNSYNHKIPTLNDLYWMPGGNPDLQPETGFSWDASLSSEPTIGAFKFKAEATYYHMNIDNWIMWIPEGNSFVWSPVNFDNVISQGVELMLNVDYQVGKSAHHLSANYGYAHSVNNSDRVDDDAMGKQLPYIPRNRWNVGYNFEYDKKLWFHYNASFTDVRYISSDEEYQTNSYTIHNAEVGYRFKGDGRVGVNLSLRVENLFDVYYESTIYYPMPLRMFWARAQFTFN